MKKRKKKAKAQKAVPKRAVRLPKAKVWLETSTLVGKHLVHAYAKKFHTGLMGAITELRLLGVEISNEYEEKVRLSLEQRAEEKKREKEPVDSALVYGIDQDDDFTFIAGHTSGGAPYGLK